MTDEQLNERAEKAYREMVAEGDYREPVVRVLREALQEQRDGRDSLANEIRNGLKQRGYWAPDRPSDLITAIFQALDKNVRNTGPCAFSLGLDGVPCSVCQEGLRAHAANEGKA